MSRNQVSQLELLNRSAKEEDMAHFLQNDAISTKSAVLREKGAVNWTKQNIHIYTHIKVYNSFWSTVKTIENPNSRVLLRHLKRLYFKA